MKKFFKLCLAVAALATMFGFASCSNGSSDDSTANAAAAATTKKVETKTNTINGVKYEYTVTDGKVDASDSVKVAEDGSVTVTASDGSKVTLSKDGKTITYTDKEGKVYTGQTGGESITLKSGDGKEIAATVTTKTEKKTEPAAPVVNNSYAGTKYYSIGCDNKKGTIKIKITTLTIDTTSAGTHNVLSAKIENGVAEKVNDLETTPFTYTVSGSAINVTEKGKTMSLTVGANNTLKDEMDHTYTKFDGDIYGCTEVTDGNNYSYSVLLIGKDGTGKFIVKRVESGVEKGSTNDLTNITVNGSSISCTSGEHQITATLSEDKSKVTVNDGKHNPVLLKL